MSNWMKKRLSIVLLCILLSSAACTPAQEQVNKIVNSMEQTAIPQMTVLPAPTQDLNAFVKGTVQALTAQAVAPTATDLAVTPSTDVGSISGTLSYPAEGIPGMAVVAFHADGGPADYYYVATAAGQTNYQIENLPAGNYWIVAYSLGGAGFPAGLAGGYTQYVACGMQPQCTDHALIEVAVSGGANTGNINPQDWYAPEGILPENPLP
jgi:hypothetical protein